MRAFYFLTKSEQGGAQSVVYELLRAHNRRGDTAIVMAQGSGWLCQETKALGFFYVENPYMRKTYNPITLLRAAYLYRKAVRANAPDIVSIHSSFSGIIGRIFRVRGIPVVYTAHGWGFTYGGGFKFITAIVEKIASWSCERIICVCNSDRAVVKKYHIAPEKKISIIYNGVDTGEYISNAKSDFLQVSFIGRFAHPKRQDVLVKAYEKLSKPLQEKTRVVFIGSGPNEKEVKEMTKNYPTSSFVFKVRQSRENTLQLLTQSNVCVLVSDSEGFPMSVVEALSVGVPVIANSVGGIPEAVDDTVGKLLPKEPNEIAVAQALEILLSDSSLRSRLSSNAKSRGQQFSAKKMCEETFKLYDALIWHH